MKTNKKVSKFSRMKILALAILVSVGILVGGFADAIELTIDELNELLRGQPTQEQSLGGTTNDDFWIDNNSAVIYLGHSKDVGIRRSSGILQYLQSGTWSAMGGGGTPGDEGWLEGASELFMYPATGIDGDNYRVVFGSNIGTSSPSDKDTEVEIRGGGGLVVQGVARVVGAFFATSTAQVTGATTLYSTLKVVGNTTLDGGTLSFNATGADKDATFYGQTNVTEPILFLDASTRRVGIGTTTPYVSLGVEGDITGTNIMATGTLKSLGHYTGTTGSSTHWTASTYMNIGGSSGVNIIDGTISEGSGALSFDNENLTTTGNLSAATITATGGLIVDTDSLYVDNSGNSVGVGTTTPFIKGSFLTVKDDLAVFDSTTPNDYLARIYAIASDDDGSLVLYANAATTTLLNGNGTSYITAGTVGIGTTTSSAELSILEATNEQLQLGYNTTNYGTFKIGSGGDLVVVATGGDISFSNENLLTTGTLGAATTTISAGSGLIVDTNTFVIDAGGDKIGIGTTTPNWQLQMATTGPSLALSDTSAGANAKHWLISSMGGILYIGTSTDRYATSSPAALTVWNDGKIGIGTSTPMANLSIGTAAATSTIATGKFCQYVVDQKGRKYWVTLNMEAANAAAGVFATSSIPCN